VAVLESIGVQTPVAQAGMGGGLSRHELAATVSEAGGLGTIAVNGADAIDRELSAARKLTGRPLAVNVLLPFARRDWFEAASAADVVVTFWGTPKRRTGGTWVHQCGSVAEARAASAAGADAVIVQGVEAGGHVRGTQPLVHVLEEVLAAVDIPVVAAGGIGTAEAVCAAIDGGADAVRVGTRFVAAAESDAHPVYVDALVDSTGDDTVVTKTFSVGWPDAPHRVLASSVARAESTMADPVAQMHVPGQGVVPIPRFSTSPPTTTTTGDVAAMALYAGRAVGDVRRRQPAAEIVAELTAAL
jgi:NAD(P)H-dependent flavin oxidoreductase YrpB (nitropropane dioxygenase family)